MRAGLRWSQAAPDQQEPGGPACYRGPVAVIEVEGLRKEYRRLRGGRTVAVDGLDLSVPEGGVYGFLGPNGAGKTTTIRCLLGLVHPTAGRATLMGARGRAGLRSVMTRVGSIVEAPAFTPRMSGRRNLELLGAIDGIGRRRVRDVLERVGLGDRADDPVRAYSLGMKQRLGIAAALLKDPAVLILDEPANGLDPQGIRWLRDLLRSFAAEGRTVLISSHVLAEVAQTVDDVVIIHRGRLVRQAAMAEVLAQAEGSTLVRTPDPGRLRSLLTESGFAVHSSDDGRLTVAAPPERVGEIAAAHGVVLHELMVERATLEEAFLELTGEVST